ncbi:MAG TPA: hypothetical protein VGL47_31540 [Amycolatopsis sp.]|uniref:hypothetical protein n=1 Tax=Amycolatopsis sp. TaxID=37632 RepID=UPI002F40ABD2
MNIEEFREYWFGGHWFDRTLHNWHVGSYCDMAAYLDIDTGLAEILIASRYKCLVADVADVLDIDAGLAAIVPPVQTPDFPLDMGLDAAPFRTFLGAYTARFVLRPHADRLLARAWLPLPQLPVLRQAADLTARAYDFAREVDAGEDLDRSRVHRFAEEIDRLNEMGLGLVSQYDVSVHRVYALLGNPARIYRVVEVLSESLGRTIRDLAHQFGKVERYFARALECDSNGTSLYARAHELARVVELLEEAITSMSGADFTDVNLRGIPLDGVRWNDDTRWPEFWAERIRSDSVLVGPGLWEIRAGGAGTGLSAGSPVCHP